MRAYWKWVIQSIPSLLLGLLMFASMGTPRHGSSNVESWLRHLGIQNVPPWVADKVIDTWIFWIAFVGFCVWAVHLYGRPNLRNGKLSMIIREGEPWVQAESGIDRSQASPISGRAYTYRIALINSDDATLRNVEVKFISLEKKPENYQVIGSHLKLRHDRVGATNFNVYPAKDPQCMDATFVDVFTFFVGSDGSSFLRVASLPEDIDRRIPVDKYDVKVMATSESGEMAIAEMAFILRPNHIPDLRLLKMQSFPGAGTTSR